MGDLPSEGIHLFGECGGGDSYLTVRSDVVDLHDLRLETHVKHFISYQIGNMVEAYDPHSPQRVHPT